MNYLKSPCCLAFSYYHITFVVWTLIFSFPLLYKCKRSVSKLRRKKKNKFPHQDLNPQTLDSLTWNPTTLSTCSWWIIPEECYSVSCNHTNSLKIFLTTLVICELHDHVRFKYRKLAYGPFDFNKILLGKISQVEALWASWFTCHSSLLFFVLTIY